MITASDHIEKQAAQVLGLSQVHLELGFEPFDEHAEILVSDDGGRLDVVYVAIDPMPDRVYWHEDGERGVFRRFRSTGTRERHLRRLNDHGAVVFDVVETDAGLEPRLVGSVRDSVGLYALPEIYARKVRIGEASFAEALKEAERILRTFGAWKNGEICGVVVDRFRFEPETRSLSWIDSQPEWLQLDPESAKSEMRSFAERRQARDLPKAGPIR